MKDEDFTFSNNVVIEPLNWNPRKKQRHWTKTTHNLRGRHKKC